MDNYEFTSVLIGRNWIEMGINRATQKMGIQKRFVYRPAVLVVQILRRAKRFNRLYSLEVIQNEFTHDCLPAVQRQTRW